MKEIFISTSDTDDNLSSVKASIASLVRESENSGSALLVFDNGSNEEVVEALLDLVENSNIPNVTVFTGDRSLAERTRATVFMSSFKDLKEVKLPAQFIVVSGSSSYLMRRGKEWHGYENQPETTRLALETLSRIRRLFF